MRERVRLRGGNSVRRDLERWFERVVLIFLLNVAAIFLLGVLAKEAFAHDWYPLSCCSDKDCWPTGTDYFKGAREPDPVAVKGGWRLFDGVIVPYDRTRISPDGAFHVCRYGGRPFGKLIEAGKPCLWVPGQLS